MMIEKEPLQGLSKKGAKKIFADVIKFACPECDTPAGKLCNTRSVWVHLARFKLARP